jgi:hypothetical protein
MIDTRTDVSWRETRIRSSQGEDFETYHLTCPVCSALPGTSCIDEEYQELARIPRPPLFDPRLVPGMTAELEGRMLYNTAVMPHQEPSPDSTDRQQTTALARCCA